MAEGIDDVLEVKREMSPIVPQILHNHCILVRLMRTLFHCR